MGCVSTCHLEPNPTTHNCLHYGSMRCFLHRRLNNRWLAQMVAILNISNKETGQMAKRNLEIEVCLFVWDTKLRKSLSLKWFNQHYMMILQTDLYYQRPVWQQHQVAQKDKLVKQNPSNQQTKCFQCSAPRIPYGVLFLGIYPESR